MVKFSLKIDDLEVRSCNQQLLSGGVHTTAEIVQWYGFPYETSCLTVAYWMIADKERILLTVCDRDKDVDREVYKKLVKRGRAMLKDMYNSKK